MAPRAAPSPVGATAGSVIVACRVDATVDACCGAEPAEHRPHQQVAAAELRNTSSVRGYGCHVSAQRLRLGREALRAPAAVWLAHEVRAVVEAVRAPLPELDDVRAQAEAAPELRARDASPNSASSSAARASSPSRPSITEPCRDAHAPTCEPRPREAKYASDSAAVSRSTAPSRRSWRCSAGHHSASAATGLASSSRRLAAAVVRVEARAAARRCRGRARSAPTAGRRARRSRAPRRRARGRPPRRASREPLAGELEGIRPRAAAYASRRRAARGGESAPDGARPRGLRAALPPRRAAEPDRGLERAARTSSRARSPLLALVFVGELLGAIDLDWSLWSNLAAGLGGLAFLVAGFGSPTSCAAGRFAELPHRVGRVELALFVILPALVPLVFGGQVVERARDRARQPRAARARLRGDRLRPRVHPALGRARSSRAA